MARVHQKLAPFQNVGANQTAILPQVNPGMTVAGIALKLGGTFAKSDINGIRIRIAGKQIVDITGAHLDAQNKYEGLGSAAGYLLIPFSDFRARTISGEMAGGIDTVALGAMDIEVDIGGATDPTLSAWALLAPPKPKGRDDRYALTAILKANETFGGAGEYNVNVPLGSIRGSMIDRVFAHSTVVTKLQVTKDGLWLGQDGETAMLDFLQSTTGLKAPQSDLVVFDPEITGNVSDAVSTLRRDGSMASFQWKYTASGAGAVTCYSRLRSTIDRV